MARLLLAVYSDVHFYFQKSIECGLNHI